MTTEIRDNKVVFRGECWDVALPDSGGACEAMDLTTSALGDS